MGICEKIWSSGVSPKKASKMQLRNVDLRSVGPSVQKLWPTTFFARKMPCILHCNEKKIRISTSRLDRGLVQKAKWSEIFRRSRIQAVPTISNNLCTKCLGLGHSKTIKQSSNSPSKVIDIKSSFKMIMPKISFFQITCIK